MSQVFNLANGHFGWVHASGISANPPTALTSFAASARAFGWLTAAGAESALDMLYFEGLSVTSAQNINTVMNRGTPAHHLLVARNALQLSFDMLYTGGAGLDPQQLYHLQWHALSEDGNQSAHQYFTHVRLVNGDFSERPEANMRSVTMVALQMFHHNSGLIY